MAFKSFLGKCFGWSRSSSYCDKTIEGSASKTSLLGQVESYIEFDILSGSLRGEHNWLREEGIWRKAF